jgi:fructokinase
MPANTSDMPEKVHGRPIVFGEVLFDRFPDDTAVLGGAPFNVAWHLQGFGHDPLFLSRVGRDEPGRQVGQAMRHWGMDTTGLQTDADYPTGAVELAFEGGQHSFDILPDQAYDHIDGVAPRELLQQTQPALLYHGTLIIRTEEARKALAGVLGASSVSVLLDVNLRAPWWRQEDLPALLQRARWVKVNDEELHTLTGCLGLGTESLEEGARRLQDAFDIELLIVTLGAQGALAFQVSQEAVAVRPETGADVVDTVGAGDAFISVAIAGLLRGWPVPLAMRRAQKFAARICRQKGATSADATLYREVTEAWE